MAGPPPSGQSPNPGRAVDAASGEGNPPVEVWMIELADQEQRRRTDGGQLLDERRREGPGEILRRRCARERLRNQRSRQLARLGQRAGNLTQRDQNFA